jgi:sugar phosphate isomerase/epimerase
MLSLSTCWNSHRHQEGGQIALEARALGFTHIEVSHGLKVSHLPGLLQAVSEQVIQVSSVHNFCPPPVEVMMDAPDAFEFTSHREGERIRALNLTESTLEMTARLGARRVVLHMGSVLMKPYTERLENLTLAGKIYSREYTKLKLEFVERRARHSQAYLDMARAALDELLPKCEQFQIVLGIETRSHYEQVPNEPEMFQLMDHYRDCPWIGFWHDFGHVQRKANLGLLNHAELLGRIAPRLLGCHVHDVEWPARDHRIPLTAGGVEFDTLLPLVPPGTPLVWELSPGQRRAHVQERLEEWRARYGD